MKRILCILLLCGSAEAQSAYESGRGYYISGEGGQIALPDYCENETEYMSCENSDLYLGLSGGYYFHENWAAEAGYNYADGFERETQDDLQTATARFANFGVRWTYLIKRLGLTGKAGAHLWDIKIKGRESEFSDGADPYYGAGLKFILNDWTSLYGEYEIYEYGSSKASFITGGLSYKFTH